MFIMIIEIINNCKFNRSKLTLQQFSIMLQVDCNDQIVAFSMPTFLWDLYLGSLIEYGILII
jgi:hypothetical protein